MIGIVVVTHGRIAEELVNAARTIVGEIPAIAAVTIGWGDDASVCRQAIERGLAEAGGGDALVLTDMFGGTPTNLSLPYLSARVEIVTGVNLPMLIKPSSSRGLRWPRRWPAKSSRRRRLDPTGGPDPEPPGTARP